MEFTLAEISNMKEPLKRLIEEKIPMIPAFKLNKLVKAFEVELVEIEEARVKLIRELGEPIKDSPNDFGVLSANVPEFQKRFNEFLNTNIDIPFEQLNLSSFGDTSITSGDMYLLDKLFTE